MAGAHNDTDANETVAPVFETKYQGDLVLVENVLSGKEVLVTSNDDDIAVEKGDKGIQVNEYTTDGNIKICSISLATLKEAIRYLPNEIQSKVKEQRVLQPDFAKSNKRFNRKSVAMDRRCNECIVNASKRSWYVKCGFQMDSSQNQMNNAWLTWSFQSNFMYAPVL